MRKVKYRKFTKAEYSDEVNGKQIPKPGTNCMTGFIYGGWFHQWIVGYDAETGSTCSMAIIETPDGLIEEVPYSRIQFIVTHHATI